MGMSKNSYMSNMQKLLFVAKELHNRGFHDIRVIPSLSPSGLSWRCTILINAGFNNISINASKWIQQFFDDDENANLSISQLVDRFIEEHQASLKECRADNTEYVGWYASMLHQLIEGELPYAFSDYFSSDDYWETSEGRQIETLPGESRFY